MAFIPDFAIENFHLLTPAEIKIFSFYCKCRNSKTGGWSCPDEFVAEKMNVSRSRVSEARRELEKKGWIKCSGNYFIEPLCGFKVVENSTNFVENSTELVENSTDFVENSTNPLKEYTSPYTSPFNQKEKTADAAVKKKKAAAAPAAAAAAPKIKIIDSLFLAELQKSLAYRQISVFTEFEKAKIWCRHNGREPPNRRFFVAWINRIKPEISGANANGSIQSNYRKPTNAEVIRESIDFYENYPS